MITNYNPLPVLFNYKNENNGYFYLVKYLNKHLNINFNDLKEYKSELKINFNTQNILSYKNIYYINFKKIKYNDFKNILLFLDFILIKKKTHIDKSFINFNINKIILFNINYISNNNYNKLNYLISTYQKYNNFIIFVSDSLSNNKYYKIKTQSQIIRLNPIIEFNYFKKVIKCNKNKILLKLINYDIIKYNLIIHNYKNEKTLSKLTYTEIYDLICKYIYLYNLIDKYLLSKEIFNYTFNLIAMYSINEIVKSITNIIIFSNTFNLNNKFKLNNINISDIYNININNEEPLISLKKYIMDIQLIYNNINQN